MSRKAFKLDKSIRKEYIYLVHPSNHEKDNVPIYKIGRTHDLANRLNEYPTNSIIYKVIRVVNCYYSEKKLINTFHMNFQHRKDCGREYFEGDLSDMMNCMQALVDAINQEIVDDSIVDDLTEYYGDKYRIYVDGKICDNVLDKNKQPKKAVVNNGQNHVMNKTPNAKKSIYTCNMCNKVFKRKNNLTYHIEKGVCKDKHFSCKYCGNTFRGKTSMYRHIREACERKDNLDICDNHSTDDLIDIDKREIRTMFKNMQAQMEELIYRNNILINGMTNIEEDMNIANNSVNNVIENVKITKLPKNVRVTKKPIARRTGKHRKL